MTPQTLELIFGIVFCIFGELIRDGREYWISYIIKKSNSLSQMCPLREVMFLVPSLATTI